jgi:hypothetical protein
MGHNFSPKLSFYRPDGTARDIYIHANSGGFKPYDSSLSPEKPALARAATAYNRPSPRLEWPTNRYVSDGSGRDFYITCNSGGS